LRTTEYPVAVVAAHGTPEYSVLTAKPVVTSAPGGVGHVLTYPAVGSFVCGQFTLALHSYEPSAFGVNSTKEYKVGTAVDGVAQPPA
jgi:hypothetical protein